MRYLYLIFPALFYCSVSFGQDLSSTSRQTTKVITPLNLYGKTFLIKDIVFENGDSSIVNSVNTAVFDSVRLHSEDIEIIDSETGLSIIVFSDNRLRSINRQELQTTSTY
ncbi:MAG: hypothetical protein RI922_2507 [Bacteroidota bacterium]|jgi:hypothetical protein